MSRAKAYKLTPEIARDIAAFVKAGGFPHVAAEAAGIPADVLTLWLEDYALKPGRAYKKYREFHDQIMQARAQARLTAEIAVKNEDPSQWLKSGPGKETGTQPGWSVPVKPVIREGNQTINLLLNPQMQSLFAGLLQLLEPFPEARAAVSQALADQKRLEHKT